MGDSRVLLIATVAASIAASVAGLAGTVQAYVSFSSRYDTLKATLVTAMIGKCVEASAAIDEMKVFHKTIDLGTATTKTLSDFAKLQDLYGVAWRKLFEAEMLALAYDPTASHLVTHDRDKFRLIVEAYNRRANQGVELDEHAKGIASVFQTFYEIGTTLNVSCIKRINSQVFNN